MDSMPVKNWQDEKHLFFAHVSALRNNSWTQYAYLTLFAERNTGHESGHLAEILMRFGRCAMYMQPSKADASKIELGGHVIGSDVMAKYAMEAKKNPGFFTDVTVKNLYRTATRMALCRDSVVYLDGCVCANPFLYEMNKEEKFKHTKNILEEQLSRCRMFSRMPTYDTSAPKVQWSGKVDDTGAIQTGYNDDLAITLAAGLHFWPLAMGGNLPGFPYLEVGMADMMDRAARIP